jgi:hypothetical protein
MDFYNVSQASVGSTSPPVNSINVPTHGHLRRASSEKDSSSYSNQNTQEADRGNSVDTASSTVERKRHPDYHLEGVVMKMINGSVTHDYLLFGSSRDRKPVRIGIRDTYDDCDIESIEVLDPEKLPRLLADMDIHTNEDLDEAIERAFNRFRYQCVHFSLARKGSLNEYKSCVLLDGPDTNHFKTYDNTRYAYREISWIITESEGDSL